MQTDDSELDMILALQSVVAWAGEGLCKPPRLGWWRTDLVDEAGGGDLFRRLAPRTWPWAGLEAARGAATVADRMARQTMGNPDHVRTLFFWGFRMDERLAERLRQLTLSLRPPAEVLPLPLDFSAPFRREALEGVLRHPHGLPRVDEGPSGRHVKEALPDDPVLAAARLAAALVPLPAHYPCPFFRGALVRRQEHGSGGLSPSCDVPSLRRRPDRSWCPACVAPQ